jgi:hypothetical protein
VISARSAQRRRISEILAATAEKAVPFLSDRPSIRLH